MKQPNLSQYVENQKSRLSIDTHNEKETNEVSVVHEGQKKVSFTKNVIWYVGGLVSSHMSKTTHRTRDEDEDKDESEDQSYHSMRMKTYMSKQVPCGDPEEIPYETLVRSYR